MAEEPEKPRHQAHAEESAHKRAVQEQAAGRAKQDEVKLRVAVDEMLKTPAGRLVMAHLFKFCGYNRSSIAVDPTTREVQVIATQHNEAMRAVYLHLRSKASYALLAPVEADAEANA